MQSQGQVSDQNQLNLKSNCLAPDMNGKKSKTNFKNNNLFSSFFSIQLILGETVYASKTGNDFCDKPDTSCLRIFF